MLADVYFLTQITQPEGYDIIVIYYKDVQVNGVSLKGDTQWNQWY